MQLRYQGHEGTVIPLPEGWPAFDHSDENQERALDKVASGFYVAEVAPATTDEVRQKGRRVNGDSI